MKVPPSQKDRPAAIKSRLVASGGRLAQDFGFNRVAGEVLVSLYLTDGVASLSQLEKELGLSKAAVSLAATQLERLGMIHRARKPGDRKLYYRSADDLGTALRQGLLKFTRSKMAVLETDLREARRGLSGLPPDADAKFLAARVKRLHQLNRRAEMLLDNPLINLFSTL
jgi:DNA-binding transcriptional regulator GbsR (MarR family)